MARRRTRNGHHPNGSRHVDARNIVIPLWMAITITIGMCSLVGTGLIAYLDLRQSVNSLSANVGGLATEVVTKTDLRLFCLELEKSSRGVVCPGSGNSLARRPS
jgi:hypothetical protein